MNNLRKFSTETDYTAATLNYPAVSWVTGTDEVHFDKTAPVVANDKVIMASYGGSGAVEFTFYNCYSSSDSDITSITFDDVTVNPIACKSQEQVDASQAHIAKYTLNTTSIGDWLSGDLGIPDASSPAHVDVLIPAQITTIDHMPNNVVNWVVEATTPPTTSLDESSLGLLNHVYVPDASLSAYQTAWGSAFIVKSILPISQYSGNLPV